MKCLLNRFGLLVLFCLSVDALMGEDWKTPLSSLDLNDQGGLITNLPEKRMSRQTIIRLLMQRDRQAGAGPIKRSGIERGVERRSVDEADDFQNCFLSPVQCMISRNRRR